MNLTMEELSKKTVMALKAYAKKNNIDLKDAVKKVEMLNILQGIEPEKPKETTVEKVALYSDHNKHTTKRS